jgi:hypothetical protein
VVSAHLPDVSLTAHAFDPGMHTPPPALNAVVGLALRRRLAATGHVAESA